MDDTTQQNAALVEEAASAAKSMEQQAQQLVTEISFFRSGNDAASAAHRSVPAGVAGRTSAPVRKMVRPAAKRPVASRPVAVAAPAPLRKAAGDDSWQEF